MKFNFSSIGKAILFSVALAPLLATANTYNVVTCQLTERADKSGWDVPGYGFGPVTINSGETKEIINSYNYAAPTQIIGVCNQVTGTNTAFSISVILTTVLATNATSVGPNCNYTGQSVTAKTVVKVIDAGAYFYADYNDKGVQMRDVVYLATSSELTNPNWAKSACESISGRMTAY